MLSPTGSIAKFAPQAKIAAAENRGGILHFEIMPKNINKVSGSPTYLVCLLTWEGRPSY